MERVRQIAKYLREVRAELRKVLWPSRRETGIFTGVVIFSVIFVALMIFVIDWVLGGFLELLLRA